MCRDQRSSAGRDPRRGPRRRFARRDQRAGRRYRHRRLVRAMIRFPRPSPERSRVTLTVVPLVAALLLAGVLLFQALDAARSHRATAERALHDYASFAAWQFGRHARTNLQTAIIAVFVLSVTRINPDDPAHGLPSPAEFASMARQRGEWCRCLDGARLFFRYDWRDGSLAIDGQEPSPAVRRWVRDTVAAHTRVFEAPRGILPLPYGSVDGKFRRLSVILTNDSYVTVFRELEGRLRVIAYVLSRDTHGNPVVSYGFESDAVPFVTPLFRQILEQEPVLPPSLLSGAPSDSVMAVTVTDLAGQPLLAAPVKFAPRYTAADTLENRFGRLVVNVALRPEIASELVVGGLPRSRVPVLLATFLLTV